MKKILLKNEILVLINVNKNRDHNDLKFWSLSYDWLTKILCNIEHLLKPRGNKCLNNMSMQNVLILTSIIIEE